MPARAWWGSRQQGCVRPSGRWAIPDALHEIFFGRGWEIWAKPAQFAGRGRPPHRDLGHNVVCSSTAPRMLPLRHRAWTPAALGLGASAQALPAFAV